MVKMVPLCQPAQLYLIFVIITVVLMIVAYLMSMNKIAKKGNAHVVFMLLVATVLLQLIYGFFVTGVLDYLCKSGRENWSWFIIISMVVITVLMGMTGNKLDKLM